MTDSEGLRKESYFAGKQAVVIMPDTGWMELVDSGWNILSDATGIVPALRRDITVMQDGGAVYGDGYAGQRIAVVIQKSC